MRKVFLWLAWLVMVLAIVAIYRGCSTPPLKVVCYRCIIIVHDEVLFFEPDNGAMFRPEKRFDKFILEVPAKGERKTQNAEHFCNGPTSRLRSSSDQSQTLRCERDRKKSKFEC